MELQDRYGKQTVVKTACKKRELPIPTAQEDALCAASGLNRHSTRMHAGTN